MFPQKPSTLSLFLRKVVTYYCYLLPLHYTKGTKQMVTVPVYKCMCSFSQMINTNNHHYPHHHSGWDHHM